VADKVVKSDDTSLHEDDGLGLRAELGRNFGASMQTYEQGDQISRDVVPTLHLGPRPRSPRKYLEAFVEAEPACIRMLGRRSSRAAGQSNEAGC